MLTLAPKPNGPCVFAKGLDAVDDPVRHGEGKFVAEQAVIDRLMAGNQVVFKYARPDDTPAHGVFPENPNGAMADIVGICDATGRIFRLMPHPEASTHVTNYLTGPGTKSRQNVRETSQVKG